MPRRVLRFTTITAAVLALAPAAWAQSAGPSSSSEARTDRRTEVATQLDLMRATDLQLKAEADRLQSAVADHEAQAASARDEAAKVEAQLQGLQVEVGDARDTVEVQKLRLRERAVAAYMHPTGETMAALLAARDYDTAHKQRVLLAEVAEHDHQVVEASVQAEGALRDKRDQVDAGRQRVEELRQQREADLSAARQARDRHAEVQRALEQRISEFQAEADELAAAQSQVAALIAARPTSGAVDSDASGGTAATPGPSSSSTPPVSAASTASSAATVIRSTVVAVTVAPSRPPTTPRPTSVPTTTPRPTGLRLAWPVSGVLTSPFGTRWGRMHQGIDIGAATGTPIRAAAAGSVFFCGAMGGYGNAALIDHGNGLVTLYGHQSQLACAVGQRVGAGQVIGYVGSTGNSTGPHLHFETRINGVAVNPMQYLG